MPILSDGFDNSLSGGGVSGYKDLSVKIFPRRVCLKSVTMFNISGEFLVWLGLYPLVFICWICLEIQF